MSLSELDGIEFVAKVSLEKDQYDEPKNVIKQAITPEHKQYAQLMHGMTPATQSQSGQRPSHHELQSELYRGPDQAPHPAEGYGSQWD